jgi:hypothetical protein
MSEERRKILEMLAQGKINVEEAEKLLSAISQGSSEPEEGAQKKVPQYLRVVVEPGPEGGRRDKVNIRVPFSFLRAGIRLASLIPVDVRGKVNEHLKEKGIDIDLSKITSENLEELLVHLNELTVDVDSHEEKVRIFCE